MAKSTAQKKSDKKKRGERSGKSRTRNNGYAAGRGFIPPKPSPEMGSAGMLVRQHPVVVTRITRSDWYEDTSAYPEGNVESMMLTVTTSDHVVRKQKCSVHYKPGEREAMVNGTILGSATEPQRRALAAKRWCAEKNAYRQIESQLGNLPRTERV